MAAIAAGCPDVTIGPIVACTAYRNPGVIAKMAEMIDEISGGRFILGLGAGWQQDEYDQFGHPVRAAGEPVRGGVGDHPRAAAQGRGGCPGEFYQANGRRTCRADRDRGAHRS